MAREQRHDHPPHFDGQSFDSPAPERPVKVVLESSQNGGTQVSVTIPRGIMTTGTPFSFHLPMELRSGARAAATSATREPLPPWLTFRPDELAFSITALPPKALPFTATVTIGAKEVAVQFHPG